jgi:hypothetical protein
MIRRLIQINQGVICGFEKELIESILPELVGSFTQRKSYFEYHFNETWITISLEDIENISKKFSIEMTELELKIKIN